MAAGCGKSGNAIQFVQWHDGVSFRHAFELLANGAAVDQGGAQRKRASIPKLPCPVSDDAGDGEALAQVIGYYHERLAHNPDALAYLEKRGLGCPELATRYRIGFADRTLGLRIPEGSRKAGADLRDKLKTLGVYRQKTGREHLNGCVTVPVFDAKGTPRQIYGRRIEPKTPKDNRHLYLSRPLAGIFNPEALKSPEIILCESIIDALTFIRHGMEAATCTFGTANFTGELFEAIQSAGIESVRLAFDGDEAGEKATTQAAERLQAVGIACHKVRFPWGMDANHYALEQGSEALRHALKSAEWLGGGVSSPAPVKDNTSVLLAAHLAAQAAEGSQGKPLGAAKEEGPTAEKRGEHWCLDIEGRSYRVGGLDKNHGFESLKITLRLWHDDLFHLDHLDLCVDGQRRRFVERAAEETGLAPDTIKRDLGKLLLALEVAQEERLAAEEETASAAPELTPEERAAAEDLLGAPDLMERIGRDFERCGMVGEQANRLIGYLACTSRLLDRPLAVIIQSTSAAGKSTLMDAVLAMFPEEERIKYSAMTGQSLYYLGETNIRHKVLAIVEEEGAERASYALKLLQSEGELTIASTGKNPRTGQMETQTYHVEGPVMIFLTTTAIDIDEELQNRCLTLAVDESRDQTRRIHEAQRRARTMDGILRREERKDVLRVHRNAQRLLATYPIWNPYVEQLTFTSERTRTRRDHEKYLALIDAIALLHQKQRETVTREIAGRTVEMLPVTLADIALANRLAPEVLGRSLDELPPQTRKLWNTAKALVLVKAGDSGDWKRVTFTRRELREEIGWSVTQVRVHLERLTELEYLAPRGGRHGLRFEYGCLLDPAAEEQAAHIGLIDPAELRDYDPNLTGQNGHLTGGDKSAPSSAMRSKPAA
jgi:DNA primase